MVLSDISIQRPVLAFVLSAMMIMFGVLGFSRMPVRELPSIDVPIISVNTTYAGASAEVVDNEITERIESVVNGIEGIKSIQSRSREGRSSVSIEFDISRSIDGAANDVRDRIGRVIRDLPEAADPPEVSKVDADSQPIIWATLTSDRMDQLELTDYVRRYMLDPISTVPGVASAFISGRRDFAMRVWLDRNAMAAREITVQDVERAIRRENAELPAGRIESRQREFTVRTDTRLKDPAAFARIQLRQEGDRIIRLGDVAKVEVGPRDDRGEFMINGQKAVGLAILRQSTANTVDVAKSVRKLMDDMRPSLPSGTSLEIRHDESLFIQSAIYEVFHAIGTAILLVVLVVWVFLRTLRATLIPVVAIPVSIVAAFGVLAALGFSVNVLTLLAFVLAVGLVVDDAIIVVENVSRRVEEGEPPLLAAYRGARQIGFAVIATTLVLIAVILPLAILDGAQGRLIREFAVALVAAIGFSCVVALTLSPMLCSKLLRERTAHGKVFQASERVFTGLSDLYARTLRWALGAPIIVFSGFGGVLVAIWLIFVALPSELAPTEDRGFMRISIVAPEGATGAYTMREVAAIQEIFKPYVESGAVAALIGGVNTGFGGSNGVNRGNITVRTPIWEKRTMSIPEIYNEVRPKLLNIPGARIVPVLPTGLSGGRGSSSNQIQVVIGGPGYDELSGWRDLLIEGLRRTDRFVGFQADYDETKPQLRVEVDRARASDLGVSITDIGTTLESMMGERVVTRYLERGEEYDVVLRALANDRANPRDLSNIFVRAGGGDRLVPLANIIKVVDTAGATELNRYNQLRSITVTANLGPDLSMGDAIEMVRQVAADTLPPEARISFEGAARQQLEASQSILFAFGMALLVAFLVLAAQFENFRLPLMILLAVPPAVFGGLLGITLAGLSLNIYTQIGLIMLIGLICKNAILIVEFANQLREEGADLETAVIEASKLRLRPILMTSIATVFGAVPLAIATGAGAEARMAIGWVIVAGVSIGTLLSLYLTPVLYRLFAHGVEPIGTIRRRLQAMEAARPESAHAPGVPAE